MESDRGADPLREMKKHTTLEEALEDIERLKAETKDLQNKLAKSKVDKFQMKKKALKSTVVTTFESEDDGKTKTTVGRDELCALVRKAIESHTVSALPHTRSQANDLQFGW